MSTHLDEAIAAAVDMIGRSGAESIQIRFSEEDEPIVWFAVAQYGDGKWEADAGHTPTEAVLRLVERLVDGAECTHCHKMTAFDPTLDSMPFGDAICWYQYDPELKTIRRGCE